MPAIRKPERVQQEEQITKTLKKALIDKGWTVAHLAELCDVQSANLSRTINHPMSVRFETIVKIFKKLGINSIPI